MQATLSFRVLVISRTIIDRSVFRPPTDDLAVDVLSVPVRRLRTFCALSRMMPSKHQLHGHTLLLLTNRSPRAMLVSITADCFRAVQP